MGKANTKSKQIKEVVGFGDDDYKFNRGLKLGTKIHRLTLVSEVGIRYTLGKRHAMFLCDCNQIVFTNIDSWQSGKSKSCGCLQQEITSAHFLRHGLLS